MRVVLSDTWLRAVKPPSVGRIEGRDANASGLVVRITANGVISWAVRGRRLDGREARITLGRYPYIGSAEARRRARIARGVIADGGGPMAARRLARAEARRRLGLCE